MRGIVHTCANSYAIPGALLTCAFALGCTMPFRMSGLAISNESSKTITLNGVHDGENRSEVRMTLPPGGTMEYSIRDSGEFTGSIMTDTQRWSKEDFGSFLHFNTVLHFVDDPNDATRLKIVPIQVASDNIDLTQTRYVAPVSEGEYKVVNRTDSVVLVRDMSKNDSEWLTIDPRRSRTFPILSGGDIQFVMNRNGASNEVVLSRRGDRTWIVR